MSCSYVYFIFLKYFLGDGFTVREHDKFILLLLKLKLTNFQNNITESKKEIWEEI